MGRPLRDRDGYTTPEPAEAPQPAGSGAVSGWKVNVERTCAGSLKSIDLPDNPWSLPEVFERRVVDFLLHPLAR
jgi:hypothetical protein